MYVRISASTASGCLEFVPSGRIHVQFATRCQCGYAFIAEFVVVVVHVCVCAGHTWNIPDSVMSLTLIAAGSSVPDAIASLIVVRDGMMSTLLLGHRVK